MKNTIITKLTSRKFLASAIAFVASLLTVIFSDKLTVEETELIKNGIFILCVYIFGESGVDIARILRQSFESGETISEILPEEKNENTIPDENTVKEESIIEVTKEADIK